MKIINSMKKLEEIEAYLGFDDDKCRSTVNWCRENNVPLFQIGKATYASEQMFEQAISRIIRRGCFSNGFDGDAIISAMENDDKVALAELTKNKVSKDVERAFAIEKLKGKNDFAAIKVEPKKRLA